MPGLDKLIRAMKVGEPRSCTFQFTSKPPLPERGWSAASLPAAAVPVWLIKAPGARVSEIRQMASGIAAEAYVLLADMGDTSAAILKARKGGGPSQPLIVPLQKPEDFDKLASVLGKLNLSSNALMARLELARAIEELSSGVEREFTNRGLFSSYFLKERLAGALKERSGRSIQSEAYALWARLSSINGGIFPAEAKSVPQVLKALGFSPALLTPANSQHHAEYALMVLGATASARACCIVADAISLDVRTGSAPSPSYQAVDSLRHFDWAILTNGRLWRLYSSRVASSSTNYFELDMAGVVDPGDARLRYFAALFSAAALEVREDGITDLDAVYEGGVRQAKEVEEDLRSKVFEGQLFLNLVRAVLGFEEGAIYGKEELSSAKERALKILYRVLFLLYAESRGLLPMENEKYAERSMEALRGRLDSLEKVPDGTEAWEALMTLFRMIREGDPEANLPEYDGELFAFDPEIDSDGKESESKSISESELELESKPGAEVGAAASRRIGARAKKKNRFLVPALRDLTTSGGRGIDYQNLGVRHLGSLYEALLEYEVRQAEKDLIVYEGQILEASFLKDVKAKPESYIAKGQIYLTSGGLARKGTGSYYTPDEIVRFLVSKGLEPHLKERERKFLEIMERIRALRGALRETERGGTAASPDERELGRLERESVEVLLGLKVVDPSMGSGHFLVAAVNTITNWIIKLLKENPDAPLAQEIERDRETILSAQKAKGILLKKELLTDTVILKRIVMKRCIYGVDINPLAVELAKLSLWLDSFTIGTPLTFLDHHMRCGDSLMGLWKEDLKDRALQSVLQRWEREQAEAGEKLLERVSLSADLTLEERKRGEETYEELRRATEAQRVLLDRDVGVTLNPDLMRKVTPNLQLIEEELRKPPEKRDKFWKDVEEAVSLARNFRAFHWEFEFPDAFVGDAGRGKASAGAMVATGTGAGGGAKVKAVAAAGKSASAGAGESAAPRVWGFDLVVMNPPWEAVKPDDDDFFSVIYPGFRKITSKPEKRKVMDRLLQSPEVRREYEQYQERIEKKLRFYKSGEYTRRGSGDTNLWKLFLERGMRLLAPGGTISVVLPSGIITDEGAKELREELLFRGRLRALYELENKNGIFPDVHRSYKFALLVWDRGGTTEEFPAAFYLHDLAALEGKAGEKEAKKFLTLPARLVKKISPDSLSIPEPRDAECLAALEKLYENPLLGDESKGWSVQLIRELDRTGDSDLFRRDGKGWPLVEGKHFHQFIPDYERIEFTVDPQEGLERTGGCRAYKGINEKVHNLPRLVFRGVARGTDVRSMIACIMPPRVFFPNNAIIVHPLMAGKMPEGAEYYRLIAYLCGVMNSFAFDFAVRQRVSANLNFFFIYQNPVPPYDTSEIVDEIVRISAALSFRDDRYEEAAKALGTQPRQISVAEMVDLLARLNALAALHYGLSKREYQVIANSFEGFEEDPALLEMRMPAASDPKGGFAWTDILIRKINGEARRLSLKYFDEYYQKWGNSGSKGKDSEVRGSGGKEGKWGRGGWEGIAPLGLPRGRSP